MRRIIPLLAMATIAIVPAAPAGASGSHKQHTWHQVAHKYLHHRHEARKAFGVKAIGRDIARDGIRVKLGAKKHHQIVVRKATKSQLATSTRTYKRWLAPPPAPVVVTDTPAPVAYAPPEPMSYTTHTTYSSGGASPVPTWITNRESGGSYTAVNPSSGAYGKYQIIPSTWAATCGDLGHDPAGQDQCAARLVESQGLAPWGGG